MVLCCFIMVLCCFVLLLNGFMLLYNGFLLLYNGFMLLYNGFMLHNVFNLFKGFMLQIIKNTTLFNDLSRHCGKSKQTLKRRWSSIRQM